MRIVVSGGFDPIHVGHIELFKKAKELGDFLTVIVNGDSWLERKKGKIFLPLWDRMKIIEAIKYVDEVVGWTSQEDDVAELLEKLRPDIFANGGDRVKGKIPTQEEKICKKLGIKMVFGVGDKIRSSSELLKNYEKNSCHRK